MPLPPSKLAEVKSKAANDGFFSRFGYPFHIYSRTSVARTLCPSLVHLVAEDRDTVLP